VAGMFIRRLTLNAVSGTTDTTLNATFGPMPGKLSGYDDEDGRFNGATGMSGTTLVLDLLPDTANALLEYVIGGVAYNLWPNPTSSMVGNAMFLWDTTLQKYVIPNFDADNLRLLFKFAYQLTTEFRYSYIDEAGVKGDIARYVIEYTVPLPVEIIAFNCQPKRGGVLITWTTANELNSSHFDVMRSANGENWQRIGSVQAAGTSHDLRDYSFFDGKPLMGMNYYRLKAIDRDGSMAEGDVCASRVTPVSGAEVSQVNLYPNPTLNRTTVSINSAYADRVALVLTTAEGKEVRRLQLDVTEGLSQIEIDLADVVPGVYLLRVNGAGIDGHYRIIKQ